LGERALWKYYTFKSSQIKPSGLSLKAKALNFVTQCRETESD
jgi:hypothetical protein